MELSCQSQIEPGIVYQQHQLGFPFLGPSQHFMEDAFEERVAPEHLT